MGYALGLDLGGGPVAAAVSRPEGASPHEHDVRDVHDGAATSAEVDGLLDRLGDPLPPAGDGTTAALRLAGLVSSGLRAVVAVEGEEPDAVVVAHPSTWGPYRAGLLRAALGERGIDAELLPAAAAAVAHLQDGSGVTAVLDVREEHLEVTVVASTTPGTPGTLVGPARTVPDLGSADVDDAVLAHVRRVALPGSATPPSRPEPGQRRDGSRPGRAGAQHRADGQEPVGTAPDGAQRQEALELRAACTHAGAQLITTAAATVTWTSAGLKHEVRIVAGELDDSVRPRAGRAIAAAATAVTAVAPGGVDRVLLMGRIAAMPLLTELVAERFEAPVTVLGPAGHPVARGAAHVARTLETVRGTTADPADPVARTARGRRAHVRHARRRPSGAVTVVGGGVLALGIAAMAVWGTAVASPGSPARGHTTGATTTLASPTAVPPAFDPPFALRRPPAVLGPGASPASVPPAPLASAVETVPAG